MAPSDTQCARESRLPLGSLRRRASVINVVMSAKPVRIGILGDFNPEYHSHLATNASLQHAVRALGRSVESEWIPTPSLLEPGAEKALGGFDGLWISPGSPYKSMAGMLAGIQRARLGYWPLIAT